MRDDAKLVTSLKICAQRLRIVSNKKTEIALKARKDVVECIKNNRHDTNIKCEAIIRQDYYNEALDLLEGYCDLLVSRVKLFTDCKELDSGLAEIVSTIVWAAPRLTEITELSEVTKLIASHLGSSTVKKIQNDASNVNERIKVWLTVTEIPSPLIEKYLVEIAAFNNLTYTPKSSNDELVKLRQVWTRETERAAAKAKCLKSLSVDLSDVIHLPDVPNETSTSLTTDSQAGKADVDINDLVGRLNNLRNV